MIFNDGEEKTGAVCKPGALLCSRLQGRRQTENRTAAGCSAPLSRGGSVGGALHSKPYRLPTFYTGGAGVVILRLPIVLQSEAADASESPALRHAAAEAE